MARIIRFHQIGGPEVLQLDDVDVPPPGPDEVRIAFKALGLNRAEAAFRAGYYLEQPELPSKIGYEGSGIVDAIGAGVSELKPGDHVSVMPPIGLGKYGMHGELANVPANCVVKHPGTLSFVEAAALWMPFLTAYGALVDIARIQPDDFVAIPAASSSVGLAAIQICNRIGATPIAITRTQDKVQALKDAGAGAVIVSSEEDIAQHLWEISNKQGVRVVFDPVSGPWVEKLAAGMAKGGILFQYGKLTPEPTPFPMAALMRGISMRGYLYSEISEDPVRLEKAKNFVLSGLADGSLHPTIAKTFPLRAFVEAHQYLESNQQFGKVVVTVP